MDGLTFTAVYTELKKLTGGRIEKIQQPEKDELLISIHSAGGSYRLLISASADNGRIMLTEERKLSPVDAPAFLMLLRKHLTGAKIDAVEQPFGDRIAEFKLTNYSELRDEKHFVLICELMGRHSNIILAEYDPDDRSKPYSIIDSIRRVPPSMSSARLILPKLDYAYPPSKQKMYPASMTDEAFEEILLSAFDPSRALSDAVYGLSPAVSKRLLASVGFPEAGAHNAAVRLKEFYSDLLEGRFVPCIVYAGESPVCTLPFEPGENEDHRVFSSMSEALDEFYSSRAKAESIKRRTSAYEHNIKNAIAKLEKKTVIFNEAISSEEDNEKLRLYGELLTANMYSIPSRIDKVSVPNYYTDPAESVTIPLDPRLTAAENAQRYYVRYRKAKLAREHALKMQQETAEELSYLDELLYTLSCCDNENELNEIRQELIAAGYAKDDTAGKNRGGKPASKQKLPPSKPYCFTSRDGIPIFVGKNNRQNDKLTMSTASPEDTWLHVKDIHGSHVVIKKGGAIPDTTLYDAAVLAAYYSKARGSGSVPVDYTLVKYVKKPSGSKPGMVIYTHQHTVYVKPDQEHLKKLLRQ